MDPIGSKCVKWIKMDQFGSKKIIQDQIGFAAYGAALMIEIKFQSCFKDH